MIAEFWRVEHDGTALSHRISLTPADVIGLNNKDPKTWGDVIWKIERSAAARN